MSSRKLIGSLGMLMLGLAYQGATPAPAREVVYEQGSLRIVVIKPDAVTLNPGGQAKVIRIQGSGLEAIKKIQLIRADKMVHNVTGAYHTVSRGIGELKLQAAADAELGNDYRLIFVTPSSSARPPIQVSVEKATP